MGAGETEGEPSENQGSFLPVFTEKSGERMKQLMYFSGPTIFTDRTFVESLIKFKVEGETHVALCLAKSKDPKYPITTVEDIYSVGLFGSLLTLKAFWRRLGTWTRVNRRVLRWNLLPFIESLSLAPQSPFPMITLS